MIAVYTVAGRAVASSAAVGDWLNALGFGTDDDVVFAGDAQGRVHRFGVTTKKLTVSVPLRPAQ